MYEHGISDFTQPNEYIIDTIGPATTFYNKVTDVYEATLPSFGESDPTSKGEYIKFVDTTGKTLKIWKQEKADTRQPDEKTLAQRGLRRFLRRGQTSHEPAPPPSALYGLSLTTEEKNTWVILTIHYYHDATEIGGKQYFDGLDGQEGFTLTVDEVLHHIGIATVILDTNMPRIPSATVQKWTPPDTSV